MDKSDRQRFKQLALDVIVELPYGSTAVKVAEALEKCVDELEDANDKCPICSACEDHGNGDGIVVSADTIVDIHRSLAGMVSRLKDSTVGNLAENLAALEDGLDELEALTVR